MAVIQRFITYIYKYENDEKKENAGFAKVEIRGGTCRIEVHIRNINMDKPESIVYLFARKDEIMQSVPVGNMNIQRGNGDIRYTFETKELLNFDMTMEKMEGIFIPLGESRYLASQWKEGEIREGRFRILEKRKEEPKLEDKVSPEGQIQEKQESSQASQEQPQEELKPQSQEELTPQVQEQLQEQSQEKPQLQSQSQPQSQPQKQQQNQPQMQSQLREQLILELQRRIQEQQFQNQNARQNPEENIQATEIPMEKFFEENGWDGIFQKMKLKLPIFFPFEGKEIECVKMDVTDLRQLPKKYWYLANNSFLLHGYFNYKHILMGEITENERKQYFIGVPGIFQNQERVMAMMFGFPEFRTAKSSDHKTGNFGYWYRII